MELCNQVSGKDQVSVMRAKEGAGEGGFAWGRRGSARGDGGLQWKVHTLSGPFYIGPADGRLQGLQGCTHGGFLSATPTTACWFPTRACWFYWVLNAAAAKEHSGRCHYPPCATSRLCARGGWAQKGRRKGRLDQKALAVCRERELGLVWLELPR